MARKLQLGARQPSGRLPLMRRRLPSTVISKCSLRMPANSTLTTTPLSVAYTSVLGVQLARAEPSREPPRERVTKCTDELTLHMVISAERVYQPSRIRKRRFISFSRGPQAAAPCARETRSCFGEPRIGRQNSRSECPAEN